MKRRLCVVVLLLLAAPVVAQPSLTIWWDQPADSLMDAQGFTYRFYLDALPGVILQGVACKTDNNVVVCNAPLPLPSIGAHRIALTAENAYGEGSRSQELTFRYPSVPGAPQNLRILKGQ